MRKWKSNSINLIKKIVLLLLLFDLCRLMFYFFNHSCFSDLSFSQLIKFLFFGLRFDVSAIVLSNSVFIVLYLLPFSFRENKWYRIILKSLFIIVNSIALLANCIDLVYFQFTLKRSTSDVLHYLSGNMGNDLKNLLPVFVKDYWYIFILWIAFTFSLVYLYNKTETQEKLEWKLKTYIKQSFILIITVLVSLILYRGGFQLKPITIVDAGEYSSSKNAPLLLNTPFTILKTLDLQILEPTIFYKDEAALKKLYNPYHKGKKGQFKKLNVFVIILESFSKEYVGAINNRAVGYTPFLDSLISQSLTFTNAYANGKKSIEGIPAITASIPTWMNEAYITSPYGGNQINSLASLLKKENYYTAFFHGGTNGTMGFDAFAHFSGYDNYFGRAEYNNEKDYDGNWGIWDEEFLQYTANTINQKQQPFFATVFTLSSHHPFAIPEKYKNKFKESPLPIERSILYADYSLKQFFETAKKMSWFNSTLFVLCADHTGTSGDIFYSNQVGSFTIPIVFYLPNSNLKGLNATITNQIDIMPSVLDYLNYPNSYFAFGQSVFDTISTHKAITYNSGTLELLDNSYVYQFDGEKEIALYNYKKDSLMKTDIRFAEKNISTKMDSTAKAIYQTYQQSLINNKMH